MQKMDIDAYIDWLNTRHGGMASLASMEEFMDMKPGDRVSVRIGDELWTEKIAAIKAESPLFDPPRVSWWRRFVTWLGIAPAPVPVAVLPTVAVDFGSSAQLSSLEKTLAILENALAVIDDMENDPA